MTAELSRRRLEWLVRSRGTDLALWPTNDRVAALDLLRRSPEAQAAFADALAHEAPGEPASEGDCAVFARMQCALRNRLAPLPVALRGLCVGALVACMAAGLYLAFNPSDPDPGADPFNTAQTISFAALDQ